MKRLDARKAFADFAGLQRKIGEFDKRRLLLQPGAQPAAERAFSVVEHVQALHSAATGTRASGGSGGGAPWSSARFRIRLKTYRLKKCMPPRTRSTVPILVLSTSKTASSASGLVSIFST